MITFARKEWIPQLKQIWKECFHDEDSYIDFYFHNRFVPEEMVVWVEDEIPVAMASILPASRWIEDEGGVRKHKLYYIYAVATLPAYAGRGISSSLMRFILEWFETQQAEGLLVPADRDLVDFYQKRGFYPVLERTKEILSENENPNLLTINQLSQNKNQIWNNEDQLSIDDEELDAVEYKKIRDTHLGGNNYVEWDLKGITYAINENRFIGGVCRKLNLNGESHILLGYKDKNEFIVRETTLSMEQLGRLKDTLLAYFMCEHIVVKEMICMSNIEDWGKKGNLDQGYFNRGYFNLALD